MLLSIVTERREQVEVCQCCSVIKVILLLQPALQLYVTKLARAMGGGGSWSSPKAGSHLRERARLSLLPDWCGFKPARQEAGQRSPRHGHYYTSGRQI